MDTIVEFNKVELCSGLARVVASARVRHCATAASRRNTEVLKLHGTCRPNLTLILILRLSAASRQGQRTRVLTDEQTRAQKGQSTGPGPPGVPHAACQDLAGPRTARVATRRTHSTETKGRKGHVRCSFFLTNRLFSHCFTDDPLHFTRPESAACLRLSIVEFAFHEGARHREALRIWDGRIVVEIRVQLEGHDRLLVGVLCCLEGE